MRLYVGNLAYESKLAQLHAFFSENGIHLLADISWPRDNSCMRPFCFIEVSDETGENNITALHGKIFNGRALKVNVAHPRRT